MSDHLTVTRKIHFSIRAKGRRQILPGPEPVRDLPAERIPRISRLMALAIHFESLIRAGGILDYADLAVLGHVSRARVTQIMNLLLLAPDIQEDLLFLPPVSCGKDPLTERDVRPVAAQIDWKMQRQTWTKIKFLSC